MVGRGAMTVIGGGLAGCEAAWQAAQRGVRVILCEMKPLRFSPAHEMVHQLLKQRASNHMLLSP